MFPEVRELSGVKGRGLVGMTGSLSFNAKLFGGAHHPI